ncbi:hypothetical protein HPP92_002666 [Vanilla planifolia]|uniref:Uncharacterized protein n=1 Tax=Vanilla planifolia TaxID=51239 RepID=A0A835RSZ0_VANPL|nr:hypothetical protein HPP92_002666 [Vanilla planifolia]
MAISVESDVVIDVESWPKAMAEGFTIVGEGKNLSNKAFSCFVGSDASVHAEDLRFGCRKCCTEGRMDTLDALVSEGSFGVDEKVDKEVGAQKTKKKGCKKPPKPPRPPRPLSLDSTDQKIIRRFLSLQI